VSQSERQLVRAMLIAAGFDERHLDWMVASCPSLQRCREVCNQERRKR